MEWLFASDPYTVLVSGGGGDTDTTAELTARRLVEEYRATGVEAHDPIILLPKTHPPGHEREGKWVGAWAGPERNTEIVNTAKHGVYALWNGQSRGTLDSIKKAIKQGRLTQVIYTNGMTWDQGDAWNPIEYGECMSEQLDRERMAGVLLLRLRANRKSKLNRKADGSFNLERLEYADKRAIHAFNRLAEGMVPEAGIGEDEGCWLVPSESKKRDNVQPHRIGLDGWCTCDAVTRGRKVDGEHGNECHAMYLVWMYQRLISPMTAQLADILEDSDATRTT